MNVSVRSRYGTFHPFQTSQYRTDSKLFITLFRWFDSQIVFTQQINRTCSPSVAQALSVWAAIHGKMLCSAFLRIIFLPKRGCSCFQHSTPVSFHFFHYSLLLTKSTKGFQFVKTHIRRCYFQNLIIQENGLFNGLLLIRIQIIKENREHISVSGYGITLTSIHTIVHKCLFLIIPESRL